MSSSREDALSSDELRKRLYQTFKNKGVLDTFKAQLRHQLIQELKHPPLTGQEPVPRPVAGRFDPLLVSACNNIVADHLRISGYEYTLSVFYPESGLCNNTVFTTGDLLQHLRVSPGSAFYTLLSTNKDDKDKGLLISLLTQLTRHHADSLRQDADTQTTSSSSYGESLVEKMKMIDKEYENLTFNKEKLFSFQSQLATYKIETQAQLEEEMNTKMKHFKDVEIAKVRMEEKSKFHKEFEKLKQELERTYEMKAKALVDREKNAIERLQRQQEIEEKNIYDQRQMVLKEIETFRNRENELKMREDAFEKTSQIHGDKVKMTEELLRRRELALKTLEDTHDQRLQNELSRYQLELKDQFTKRAEKLAESENRNQMETARIQKEAAVIDAKLEEHSRVCSQLEGLQAELDKAKQQIPLLTQQNELLQERLETMSDYSNLKIERAALKEHMQLLKKQLEETHADLTRDQLAMQMDVRRLQSARELDADEFDNQKQVLQAQLQSEVERSAQLKAQLAECEEKSQWMAKYVEDFQTQLQLTQQALENEVLLNPKPSLVDRSVPQLSADKLVPPDVYVDRALLRGTAGYDDVCEAGARFRGHRSPWSGSPDSDMELVAGARARFQELQREAETLEEAYRNYQQRAVHSTVLHMAPQKVLSPKQARPSHRPDSFLRKQDPPHSYTRAIDKPTTSNRPLSPHTILSPLFSSYDTRNILPPEQARVSFSDEHHQLHGADFAVHSPHSVTEPLFLREELQDEGSASYQCLPSIPHSSSKDILQREHVEGSPLVVFPYMRSLHLSEAVVSPVTFPQLPPNTQLSPAPRDEVVTSGDFSPELSPPRSPQLMSTARDQCSLPKLQSVFSFCSSECSSPQPERISLQDLTGVVSEPGHIPELLLDTTVPLSEEAPDGPAAPHPQDLPEDPVHLQGQTGESLALALMTHNLARPQMGNLCRSFLEVAQISGERASVEKDEEEELKWERERKERQEKRQREQEEAREREREELERLEKETLLEEVEQPAREEVEEEEPVVKKRGDKELEREAAVEKEEPETENPLEKYMKMVLEAREQQNEQNPAAKEETGHTSLEARSLSEEKDDSIAAFSQKDEEDDFW